MWTGVECQSTVDKSSVKYVGADPWTTRYIKVYAKLQITSLTFTQQLLSLLVD